MVLFSRIISEDLLLGVSTIDADCRLGFRERERRAVLQLARHMLHDEQVVISHNDDGKPSVTGYNISVSHTRGYAAVILSKTHSVGVDIEYLSDRVERIAQRFLHPDEQSTLATASSSSSPFSLQLLKAWCAKEAVYKYFSEDHLAYSEMRCRTVDDTQMKVSNMRRSETVSVAFMITDAYVLAWVE